jgi:DnaK suppressor protein
MTSDTDIDIEALTAKLLEEKEALIAATEATAAAREPVELDQQSVGRLSRMDAMQVQEMDKAGEARRQVRIARIKSALERIESEEFGECMNCGEDIAPARLNNDPTVATCITCARGGD